jgi:hypothetical protein
MTRRCVKLDSGGRGDSSIHVRYAPNSDRMGTSRRTQAICAMCGRLRVGKAFLQVCRLVGAAMCSACLCGSCVDGSELARLFFRFAGWSVQPCVRPVCAVHMTAGHNAFRGSGPGQKPGFDNALALVGCPDRRIGRLHYVLFALPTFISRRCRRDLGHAARATGSL